MDNAVTTDVLSRRRQTLSILVFITVCATFAILVYSTQASGALFIVCNFLAQIAVFGWLRHEFSKLNLRFNFTHAFCVFLVPLLSLVIYSFMLKRFKRGLNGGQNVVSALD